MSLYPALPCSIIIDDASKVGEARRLANGLAQRQGFDEAACGNVAIVVTEAATNLLKFASGGELIFREIEGGSTSGLEVLSIDRGPGMRDVNQCLADGFSSSGTLGGGLGAIGRLSAEFDIHSVPGLGTVAVSHLENRKAHSNRSPPASGLEVGVVSLPMPGESLNGDAWAIKSVHEMMTDLMIVDGLGHGPLAALAAAEASRVFNEKSPTSSLEGLLRSAHEALRHTRGAAMAVCRIDHRHREARFAGIGNISALIVNPGDSRSSNMVSYNGTVGHVIRKIQEFSYPWNRGALLIMHSDGLSARWDLGRYPGLSARHPGLIAAVLYRDFRRERDDATVFVAREREEAAGWR